MMRSWMMLSLLSVLGAATASAGGAAGGTDPWTLVAEGAPAYGVLQPAAVLSALKRMGVGDMAEVKALRQQLGGLDVLDPAIIAPTGIDPGAQLVGSAMEPAGPKALHHRLVCTLRDKGIFGVFLTGLSMTGQLAVTAPPIDSELGKAGVIGHAVMGGNLTVVGRVDGSMLIIDVVSVDGGKPWAAAEVVRKYPLVPKLAVAHDGAPQKGARRLLGPDVGLGAYVDGKKLVSLATSVQILARILGDSTRPVTPPTAACQKTWTGGSVTFDDAAVALVVTPEDLRLEVAWGTQGKNVPGLHFAPVDDQGVDVDLLARQATLMLIDYDVGLGSLAAVQRQGVYLSSAALDQAVNKCPSVAIPTLLVRSWPQALAALLDSTKKGAPPLVANAVDAAAKVRNLVLGVRDVNPNNPETVRYFVAATVDPQLRSMVETVLAAMGSQGTPTPLGKRTPTTYSVGEGAEAVVLGMETLPAGPMQAMLVDSKDTLAWMLRSTTPVVAPRPKTLPVAAFFADGAQLIKMLPILKLGQKDTETLTRLFGRVKRFEAELVLDGDLLRVRARTPLR